MHIIYIYIYDTKIIQNIRNKRLEQSISLHQTQLVMPRIQLLGEWPIMKKRTSCHSRQRFTKVNSTIFYQYHPKKYMSPERDHFKRRIVFQPSLIRGHVSFRGSKWFVSLPGVYVKRHIFFSEEMTVAAVGRINTVTIGWNLARKGIVFNGKTSFIQTKKETTFFILVLMGTHTIRQRKHQPLLINNNSQKKSAQHNFFFLTSTKTPKKTSAQHNQKNILPSTFIANSFFVTLTHHQSLPFTIEIQASSTTGPPTACH